MRLLCIDGVFTDDQKAELNQWPIEGEEYTLRQEVRYKSGRVGYRLMEITNPPIPPRHREPTFRATRFVVLSGESPVEIEIEIEDESFV